MNSTLKDRVLECMQDNGMRNKDVAKAASVSAPTAFHWTSGRTQSIKGEPLLRAAKAFGVTPDWLATGRGPKRPQTDSINTAIDAPAAPWTPREHVQAVIDNLPESAMPEALAFLEFLSEKAKKISRTKRSGAAIPSARKKAA